MEDILVKARDLSLRMHGKEYFEEHLEEHLEVVTELYGAAE